jgi:hypothetical protein
MARIPLTWYPGPGTRHRIGTNAEGRIPSTEDRAGKRAHRVCILDPASIRALRAIRPSPTLLRHFVTSLLRPFVTSSLRPFITPSLHFLALFWTPFPGDNCNFLHFRDGSAERGGLREFPSIPDGPRHAPGLAQRLQGAKVTSNG